MTWFRQILHAIGNALLGTRITLQWGDRKTQCWPHRTQSSGGLIAKNRPPLSNGVTGPESG